MQTRLIAPGFPVSALGLGCMGMSEFYGASDEATSIATLRRAADLGVTVFDTADMYGCGANEDLVGRALKGRPVAIATKFGNMRGPNGEFLGVNGRPDYVRKACEASLRRLGRDVIDLYYQHRVDPAVPIEETVGAMADLVREGKVRHLGLSEAAAPTIRRAAAIHPIAALQTEYSLWTRDVEADILPTCRALGIRFVAYSPLGRGFLTGQFRRAADIPADDWRRNHPRFSAENFDANLRLTDRLTDLARTKGATPAQVALAWVLAQGDDIIPIPGTRHIPRLEENLRALDITLTEEERRRLDAAFLPGTTAGDRYHPQGMQSINR
ncbi:MAG: aldo/keto reductase [Telmatospirillum sp.]|nr:aldo/keto reductase [Telmatospirillum sp.]